MTTLYTMTLDDGEKHKKNFYWRLHYKNVNHEEIRMMKFDHKEDWAHFYNRICKKINITYDKAFPLRYYIETVPQSSGILVSDEEDYEICSLIMKEKACSNDPEKGFDIYTKQNDRYPY